jgi:uncharacterized protein
MEFELRFSPEIRSAEGGKITGYAAIFNVRSADLGGFYEVIAPGAFDRALREDDIVAVIDHDLSKLLGRKSNGTLRLFSDARGLGVEIDPANTSYARDLMELVKRGDVSGFSFRFRPHPGGATTDLTSSPPIRTLTSVEVKEVSVLTGHSPAFKEANSVQIRSLLSEANTEIMRINSHMARRIALAETD